MHAWQSIVLDLYFFNHSNDLLGLIEVEEILDLSYYPFLVKNKVQVDPSFRA